MAIVTAEPWHFLSGLFPYLKRHRLRLSLGFLCVFFTNIFLLAPPWVMKYAVDDLYQSVTRRKLALYALAIIGLTLLQGIFRFTMRWLLIGVSRDIEYSLRQDVFHHLELLPMSFYQRNKTGDLMSRATNDLSNVRMLLGPGIMYSVNTIVTAAMAIAFMLSIDWRLT